MPIPIDKIPTEELRNDLEDTIADIQLCELALKILGPETITELTVGERLKRNQEIEQLIRTELARRAGPV